MSRLIFCSNIESVKYRQRNSSSLLSKPAYFLVAKHWLAKAQFAVTKWILWSKLCLLITISTAQLNLNVNVVSHIFIRGCGWVIFSNLTSVLCKSVVQDHNGCQLYYVKHSHKTVEINHSNEKLVACWKTFQIWVDNAYSSQSLDPNTLSMGNTVWSVQKRNADRPRGAAQCPSVQFILNSIVAPLK